MISINSAENLAGEKSPHKNTTMNAGLKVQCPGCENWFQTEVRIEIEKVKWSPNNSGFAVYGRIFCASCLHRNTMDKPSMFWQKWKTIPITTMKPSECPACGSHDIRLNNIDTSKEKDEVIIIENFFCKKCNGNKQQFIRGIKDFWQRVKSISIGPAEVTFS